MREWLIDFNDDVKVELGSSLKNIEKNKSIEPPKSSRVLGPFKPNDIPKISKKKFDELMGDNRYYAQPMIRGERLIVQKKSTGVLVMDNDGFLIENIELEKTIEDMFTTLRVDCTVEGIYAPDKRFYVSDCLEYQGNDVSVNMFFDRYVFVRNLPFGLVFDKLPVAMNKTEKEYIIEDTRSYSRKEADFGWQKQARGIVFKFGSGRYTAKGTMFRYTTSKY